MKLHSLKPAEGSVKKVKRIGRGEASGHGGTSTKGNKGAQSRTGFKNKLGHEPNSGYASPPAPLNTEMKSTTARIMIGSL